jgi:hypothetical protein
MATREQIMRLHTGQCQRAFVPPYDGTYLLIIGQESMVWNFTVATSCTNSLPVSWVDAAYATYCELNPEPLSKHISSSRGQ